MSIELMVTVLNEVQELDPRAKLVLLGIANHAGDGGAWPAIDTLARYASCSRSTVQRHLKKMETEGYITIDKQHGGSSTTRSDRRPNLYTIHLDRVIHNPDERGVIAVTSRSSTGCHLSASRGVIAVTPEPSYNPGVPKIRDMTCASSENVCFEIGCENKTPHHKTRCVACQTKLDVMEPFP